MCPPAQLHTPANKCEEARYENKAKNGSGPEPKERAVYIAQQPKYAAGEAPLAATLHSRCFLRAKWPSAEGSVSRRWRSVTLPPAGHFVPLANVG
jgi:hypothetical protein